MTQTTLVTGANAGIGRAAARQLLALGHRVILGCRDRERGGAAVAQLRGEMPSANVSLLLMDMSSQRSIREAAGRVDRVDVLVHNAASFDVRAKARTVTDEGFETTWATNVLGPVLLTELLLPQLRDSKDPRVITVTSKGLMMFPWLAVDLADPGFEARRFSVPRAYYQSKLALLAWTIHQAERHRDSALRFHAVRVTNVKVDLARYPGLAWPIRATYALKSAFAISPEEMAKTYSWLADDEAARAVNGGHWDAPSKPAPVPAWAANAGHRAALDALTRAQLALDSA